MKKKRIAFFVENLYGGGVQRILQIVLRNFDYEQYDVTLFTNHKEKLLSEFYPTHIRQRHIFSSSDVGICNNTWWCRIKNKVRLWVYYHCVPQTFYRLFIREKYDVGVAFIEGYATRFLSGAPEGMKKIAWLHIELDNFHWTDVAYHSRKEEMECYGSMDRIVCVSQVVKQQADKLFGMPEKTIVLHNPVDVVMIRKQADDSMMSEYLSKTHQFRIISLGSLDKRKGYDRLFVAVQRLMENGVDVELLILGKGLEEACLKDYINRNNLQDCIKLVGFVDNPYPYVKSADIYVCSSTAEGYNTAVTEALVLGKPIVSTEVSGIREQLGEQSEYGIITENSVDGIYKGLKTMIDGKTIEHYQSQAQQRGEMFALETQMNKIYNLLAL